MTIRIWTWTRRSPRPSKFEQLPFAGALRPGKWPVSLAQRCAHRSASLAEQWRLGRRPSLVMMKTRFESQFKNFGESRLKCPVDRSSFSASSIQAPMQAPLAADPHQADRIALTAEVQVPAKLPAK